MRVCGVWLSGCGRGLAGLFRCARIRISKYACGGGLGAGCDRDQRAVHGSIDHLFCHPWQNITVDWTGILRYSNPLPKSQTRQAPCRTLTDATLWRTGTLQIFWEDFGAGFCRWLRKIGTDSFVRRSVNWHYKRRHL